MNKISSTIQQELFCAMDDYSATAHLLIDKLVSETNQPEKEKIATGAYYAIEEADLLNEQKLYRIIGGLKCMENIVCFEI